MAKSGQGRSFQRPAFAGGTFLSAETFATHSNWAARPVRSPHNRPVYPSSWWNRFYPDAPLSLSIAEVDAVTQRGADQCPANPWEL